MPQANSTTSRPRATSPAASLATLPCSAVISAASSPVCALTSSRKLNRIDARRDSDAVRQSANAARAAATAASTSAGPPRSTCPLTWPVAGSYTSPRAAAVPACGLPPIQCVMCVSSAPAAAGPFTLSLIGPPPR